MTSLRRLPTRKSLPQKQAKLFDSKVFLANVGAGRTVEQHRPKQAIFSQGDRADAVFYIQEGKLRLSVLSKTRQGSNLCAAGCW